jgi:hypothetical protein
MNVNPHSVTHPPLKGSHAGGVLLLRQAGPQQSGGGGSGMSDDTVP